MHPAQVRGERVSLREFTPEDATAIHAIYGDPAATRHLSFEPRTLAQVTATIEMAITSGRDAPRTEYSLAAALTGTGEVVGFARLAIDTSHPGQSSGQIGFAINPACWGRGLGTATVQLLLRLGFAELGLHRIWGARSPDNSASAHLMRKLGMIQEGTIRHHLLVRGQWRDSIVHSILEHEWH